MRRIRNIALHDLLLIGFPILALIVLAFWATFHFVRPAPPHRLSIASGMPDGAYRVYAARYKEIFARNRITLAIEQTEGASENLERLLDRSQDIDAGFVQSGIIGSKDTAGLVSLGVLYSEPLWLFHRSSEQFTSLDQLKGKRIAVGPSGSGTRVLAMELLHAHGMDALPTRISPLGGVAASQALARGQVDAVFIVGAAHSGAVWTMFYSDGIEIFSFAQAEAYARRFPYLSVLTLPRGAIDFQRDIPNRDIKLVAPAAMLLAREEIHPALVDLMLQAATEVHGSAGLFQHSGQFPTPNGVEIPLSSEAERYYKSGKPFLQRYLPFWAATLIDRLIILLVPIVAILFPLLKIAPSLYTWRVRSKVFRYYGELKLLELHAEQAPESRSQQEWLAELDRIEYAANRLPTPLSFTDQIYTLRQHIHVVRKSLLRYFARNTGAAPTP